MNPFDEESIDQRNSMLELRHWTAKDVPVTQEEIDAEKKRLDKLYAKHTKVQIDLWERLKEAVESPRYDVPQGSTREEVREMIIEVANGSIDVAASGGASEADKI